jgi:hypothetical protein
MNQIFLGNSEEILKTLPESSIYLCFTIIQKKFTN